MIRRVFGASARVVLHTVVFIVSNSIVNVKRVSNKSNLETLRKTTNVIRVDENGYSSGVARHSMPLFGV